MEDLRKACGGQGFLRSSGMPDIVESFCDPATVEGEQVIMSLQCSRFLIKSAAQLKRGQPEQLKGSVKYLLDPPVAKLPFDTWSAAKPEHLVAMFRDRARAQAVRLEDRFATEQANVLFDTHRLYHEGHRRRRRGARCRLDGLGGDIYC